VLGDTQGLVSAVEGYKVGLEEDVAKDHDVDTLRDSLEAGKAVCPALARDQIEDGGATH